MKKRAPAGPFAVSSDRSLTASEADRVSSASTPLTLLHNAVAVVPRGLARELSDFPAPS